MVPMHHDKEMYYDFRDGDKSQGMKRWLCTEPGCTAILNEETINRITETGMRWATIPASNVYQFPESRRFT